LEVSSLSTTEFLIRKKKACGGCGAHLMKERTMLNLGTNSSSISYEVALEVLGQSRQPFMQAIHDERQKPTPSLVFIRYCENRLAALDELQDGLKPSDLDTIERILSRGDNAFKVQ
jgi:hypothetical protein